MKIPKLFYGGMGKIARTPRNEYKIKEDRIVEPVSFYDFYFLVKQGYLLADDPRCAKHSDHAIARLTDQDVLNNLRKFEGKENPEDNIKAFKQEQKALFISRVQNEIAKGSMKSYPVDLDEQAEEFANKKVSELTKKGDKELDKKNQKAEPRKEAKKEVKKEEPKKEEPKEEPKKEDTKKRKIKTIEAESSVEVSSKS